MATNCQRRSVHCALVFVVCRCCGKRISVCEWRVHVPFAWLLIVITLRVMVCVVLYEHSINCIIHEREFLWGHPIIIIIP